MMAEIFAIHGVPRVVHADRGTSMTSKTVAALLSDLEVSRVMILGSGAGVGADVAHAGEPASHLGP